MMKYVYIAVSDEIIFFGHFSDRPTDRQTDRQADRPTDREVTLQKKTVMNSLLKEEVDWTTRRRAIQASEFGTQYI